MELTGARFKPNHGALKLKDMKAVSAQEVSCCVYYTPKKVRSTCIATLHSFGPIQLVISFY